MKKMFFLSSSRYDMLRFGVKAIVLLILCAGLGSCASRGIADDAQNGGMTVVSTSVAICQILDALGVESVVGVPETGSELPEKYQSLPTVGAPMTPDCEKIKDINPDIVLSPKTLESSLSQVYTAAGINSAFLDLSSVESMYKAIHSLGKLLGCEPMAEQLVAGYESYLADYRVQDPEHPGILLLMAFPDGFYLVATEKSYVGDLVKLAGGENVYDDRIRGDENGFVNINPEDMVQRKPDKILVFAHYAEKDAFAFMKYEFESNVAWQHYDAVKQGDIVYLPSEYFGMSATLSWTEGLDYLKPIFYETR